MERKAWVASFGRPNLSPKSLLASQTGLSPYLRFGCLSTRLFYHQLTDLYKKIEGAYPPLSLYDQLLWREFLYCAATRNTHFDKMSGNSICVQIPWDKDPRALTKWANVRIIFTILHIATGYLKFVAFISICRARRDIRGSMR